MNKRFIKEDISKYINKQIGLSNLLSKKITKDIIEIFSEQITSKNLLIKNFGSFYIKEKNQRLGRNPKTLEIFTIKKRKAIIFKPSKHLVKKLNQFN